MSGLLPLFLAPLIHLGFTGPIPSLPGTLEYLLLAKNCLTGTIQGMATLHRPALLDLRLTRDFQLPERQPPPPAEPALGAGPGSGVPEACNTSQQWSGWYRRSLWSTTTSQTSTWHTIPLPTTCTFCIQYNCLGPPQQSSTSGDKGRVYRMPACICSPTTHKGSFRCKLHRQYDTTWIRQSTSDNTGDTKVDNKNGAASLKGSTKEFQS
ncbi:hypothetical protein SELMODRAFT_405418 [Selaginella moellendorffii]|uniref:Uncharacterized protein n=1 Tax=Selaginella moellendorffii TaxID=88036 RepID=D8QXA6_SELML|nr:hypothetical protein SELMODRAFT_405418 [Selaginella moellendorffii]